MVTVPSEFAGVLGYVSNAFNNIDPQNLLFPYIIGGLILPMIFNTWATKLLVEKMKVPVVGAWLIGVVGAYFSLPWGALALYVSMGVIGFTREWRMLFKILFVGATCAVLYFLLPMFYDIVSKGILRI